MVLHQVCGPRSADRGSTVLSERQDNGKDAMKVDYALPIATRCGFCDRAKFLARDGHDRISHIQKHFARDKDITMENWREWPEDEGLFYDRWNFSEVGGQTYLELRTRSVDFAWSWGAGSKEAFH